MNAKKREAISVGDDKLLENGDLRVGGCYAFVCAGPIYHGQLTGVTPGHYVLKDAAWVVETGRLNEFVKDPAGVALEAEFIGPMLVERSSCQGIYPTPDSKVTTR